MRESYIGMTDVPDALWLRRMIEAWIDMGGEVHPGGRKLHAGVMMSRESLDGIAHRWKGVWPPTDKVGSVLVRHPLVLNTVHYADYDGVDIERNLCRAVACGGPNLDALQLDMVWPDPMAIMRLKARHPSLRIILQVNAVALAQLGNDPDAVTKRIISYEQPEIDGLDARIIDDVLLDKSMGKGLGMDAQVLLPFLRAIAESQPDLGLAVAGGLGPDTLDLVEPIVREFPRISIDAQSRLRPSRSSIDLVDFSMAREYLRKAVEMFRAARHA